MKKFGAGFCVLLIFGLSLLPQSVNADVLNCQIKNERRTGGWIPLFGKIEYDLAAETATAHYKFNEQVIVVPGTIVTQNEKRVTFRFQAEGLRSKSGQYLPRMIYRSTYIYKTSKFSVTATPLGYSNRFTGRGACTVG